MGEFEKSREIQRKLVATESILNMCRVTLQTAFDDSDKYYVGPKTPDELLLRFDRYLFHLEAATRLDFRNRLTELLLALQSGRDADWSIKNDLAVMAESLGQSLAQTPASVDKAKAYLAAQLDIGDFLTHQDYDAACLLKECVSPASVQNIVASWKESLRVCVLSQERPIEIVRFPRDDEASANPDEDPQTIPHCEPISHIFWTSLDDEEEMDAISHYRFVEVFNVGEFRKTEREIESFFASTITEREPDFVACVFGDNLWSAIAYRLWMASRSPKLCGKIRPFVEVALGRIANRQHADGWWPSGIRRNAPGGQGLLVEETAGNFATGLACATLLRLSREEWQLERARDGVRWLAVQQKPSGAWSAGGVEHASARPDLLTTLLAAQAIRLSGVDGFDSTLSLADDWLMSQQEPNGTWVFGRFPLPFSTILAIEYFEADRFVPCTTTGYLSIARDFVLRSREFASEDNENSRRLAVVVAFLGVEAFLYACLSDQKVNVKIFESPNETIGMRKALTKLQTYFQTEKVLKQGKAIESRNEMDRLAYHRDQVVHKGASINAATATELVSAAVKFMNLNAQRVFGKVLL